MHYTVNSKSIQIGLNLTLFCATRFVTYTNVEKESILRKYLRVSQNIDLWNRKSFALQCQWPTEIFYQLFCGMQKRTVLSYYVDNTLSLFHECLIDIQWILQYLYHDKLTYLFYNISIFGEQYSFNIFCCSQFQTEWLQQNQSHFNQNSSTFSITFLDGIKADPIPIYYQIEKTASSIAKAPCLSNTYQSEIENFTLSISNFKHKMILQTISTQQS